MRNFNCRPRIANRRLFLADCLLPIACCIGLLTTVLLLTVNCGSKSKNPSVLTQISTFESLMAGGYDGIVPTKDIRRYGDFGIGAYKKLNGEMVMLNDTLYHILRDGTARTFGLPDSTPFADVVRFKPDTLPAPVQNLRLDSLRNLLGRMFPHPNLPYAIRISGNFAAVKTRSVPPQEKPFQPLSKVIADQQKIMEVENTTGTVVGFYFPDFMKNISVAGFHFHFISGDRKTGGHLFDCMLADGRIELQAVRQFHLILPESGARSGPAVPGNNPMTELKKVLEPPK